VYGFFIDLKAAFDEGRFWKAMEEKGIKRGLIERVKKSTNRLKMQ